MENIIDGTNEAVSEMATSLNDSNAFLEKRVLVEYEKFNEMGEQYRQDASIFMDGMTKLEEAMNNIDQNMAYIVGTINEINITIGEVTNGINDIADKVSAVANKTSENYTKSEDNVSNVERMQRVINIFEFA